MIAQGFPAESASLGVLADSPASPIGGSHNMRNRISMAAAVGLMLLGFGGSVSANGTFIGNVAAVDASAQTFSVQEPGEAPPTTFTVDAKTLIREGRKEEKFSVLEPGRGVRVTYTTEGDVALARRIDLSLPTGAAAP